MLLIVKLNLNFDQEGGRDEVSSRTTSFVEPGT